MQAETFFNQEDSAFFPSLINDGKIPVVPFLKASTHFGNFFSVLGTPFTPVKSDILGNIKKIYRFIEECPGKIEYVNDIILIEVENPKSVAVDALLWLKRALKFTLIFLEKIANETNETASQDLSTICSEAYEVTLKKYHGWMVQRIFFLVAKACPWRRDLLVCLSLGKPDMEEAVLAQMNSALVNLRQNLEVINSLYSLHNLDLNTKV